MTILSLVMRTKGILPDVPANIDASFHQDGQGRIVAYYSIPKSDLSSEYIREKLSLGTPMRSSSKRRLRSGSNELDEMVCVQIKMAGL